MFVFGGLKSLIPKIDSTTIDNHVFRLHYKFTMVALIAFVILATSKEYIGEPISCTHNVNIPEKVINEFCWIQSTYSMPYAWELEVGEDIPYPGVDTHKTIKKEKESEPVYHKYYQWVAFMLFMQAVMFYVPRYLWKMWEGGKMKMLVMDLNYPIIEDETKCKKIKLLVDYFNNNLHTHNAYAIRYYVCEILNLVNVIGQLYLTDRFLGWEFFTYGTRVLEFINQNQKDRVDPMIKLFPRMAKCRYHQFGHGGTVEKYDALCILPLNIVNEKVYIFLWFWLIVLTILTCLNLVYRIIVCKFRLLRIMLLRSRAQLIPMSTFSRLVEKFQIGDWFVLYLLSKNMNHSIFREFVTELDENLVTYKVHEKPRALNTKVDYL